MDLMRRPECADRIAAAYALGTLRGAARRRFEAQARQSPTLRALALVWQERFAAMTELQPAEAPSPNVWKRIHIDLRDENAAARARENSGHARWFTRWPARSLVRVLAALVVFTLAWYFGVQLREAHQAQYLATLQDGHSTPQLVVTFDGRHDTLTVKRVGDFHEPPDRTLQLWALPSSGPPRSLGVLDHSTTVKLDVDEDQIRDVPALAVSLEPPGGAPEGSGPTGPVIFKGAWAPAT
jgi:anti-sigma-K factor RskA